MEGISSALEKPGWSASGFLICSYNEADSTLFLLSGLAREVPAQLFNGKFRGMYKISYQ